jgi:hypothetical protein
MTGSVEGLANAAMRYACAVRDMAGSHGSLQERLARACMDHLSNVCTQGDIPDPLWDLHYAICDQVVRGVPSDIPDPFAERFGAMDDAEAWGLARRIVDLEGRLRARHAAPPWHYVGHPTALIRVMPEQDGRGRMGRETDPEDVDGPSRN